MPPNSKLGEKLASQTPRETSGARSSNRFDYQKDWVVCKLIDLHRSQDNYFVFCDYHEDVAILDHELNPQSIAFYQVKTQVGKNWKVSKLISTQPGKKGNSILGKLYLNYLMVPEETESLNFVSNAQFDFNLGNGEKSVSLREIRCCDIQEKDIQIIDKKLKKELGVDCDIKVKPPLFFQVSEINVDGHSIYAKGILSEFLEEKLPNRKYLLSPLYKTLFDEVRKKTTMEGQFNNFNQLRTKKGIGKSTIDNILKTIGAKEDIDKIWEEVRERLVSEQVPPLEVGRISQEWQKYEIMRMDPSNENLQTLRLKITTWCKEATITNPEIKLRALCNDVTFKALSFPDATIYDAAFIKAIVLMETYEDLKFSEANPQFKEEA